MKSHRTQIAKRGQRRFTRRGAVVVYVTVCGTVVIGMAALAVDLGMLYNAQAELQRTADASAVAATWRLLDEERLYGTDYAEYLTGEARGTAVAIASQNTILRAAPSIEPMQDIDVGYLADLSQGSSAFSYASASNATRVNVLQTAERGGSISLHFARLFGVNSQGLTAQATAAFEDAIAGFKIDGSAGGENAQLLPFALHVDSWNELLAGSGGDNYSYDPETGTVSAGSDGIYELNLYPGAGSGQLTPGNFGTVDIGSSNNSTADIARQILYGVNADDLSYFGGQLVLGEDGTLLLNGDTGLSAGIKDELEEIKGQPRAIPLFNAVSGPGNNAEYTIVGFAGIRILNVKLTGKMSKKEVIVQPAVVVDPTAVGDPDATMSYYVCTPVRLVD